MSLTHEELWIGAAYLVSIHREDLLKPAQREVLGTYKPDAQLVVEIDSDVLPCPLCVGRSFTEQPGFTGKPFLFKGRWAGHWAMTSGAVGCPHADARQFQTFLPTRAEVVDRWNAWVRAQTSFPPHPKSAEDSTGDSESPALVLEEKNQPEQ